MIEKPILFCSTKAVPHIALIAHLYDIPLMLRRKNKPVILDETYQTLIAATYFAEHVQIDHPIIGCFEPDTSRKYADFIIDKAKAKFNLINYSELLNDADFTGLQKTYTVIQLIVEPEYRKQLIYNRIFRLYDASQKNYVLVDQGLRNHKDGANVKTRMQTYMEATDWKDMGDIRGFIDFLLSNESPIMKSFMFEDKVKHQRSTLKVSYHNIFDHTADYSKLCDWVGKKANVDEWKSILHRIRLPDHVYCYGEYWNLT